MPSMTNAKTWLSLLTGLLIAGALVIWWWQGVPPPSKAGTTDPAVSYLNTQLSNNHFRSVYFEHNGQNLHTVIGGNPDGETLVFIHGFPSFWYSFARQLAYFHQNYRVIAIDGLGVNHSDAPQTSGYYTLQALSDHVLPLMDDLEVDQFHLIGHDWGSALALGMAQQSPDRIRTVTGISAPPQNVLLELVQTLPAQTEKYTYVDKLKSASPLLLTLFSATDRIHSEAYLPLHQSDQISIEELELFKSALSNVKRINAHITWYRANLPSPDTIQDTDFWPAKDHQLDIPALLIWGDQDQVFAPDFLEYVARRGKQVSILRLPEAGHSPHIEQADTVNEAIAKHLLRGTK